MFEPQHFHLRDPAPDNSLENIFPVSLRALALLVRNQNQPIFKTGFLNIYGAVDMIDGLQHHYDNFTQLIQSLAGTYVFSDEVKPLEKKLRHEVVAYLNRLGQFSYFTKSDFVAEHLPDIERLTPRIEKFVLFRDKHSAHRSLDAPRKEDSPHQQKLQAWALSSISAFMFNPKDKLKAFDNFRFISDPRIKWGENYLCFQMRGKGENNFINFCLEEEHQPICEEAFNVIQSLAKSKANK